MSTTEKISQADLQKASISGLSKVIRKDWVKVNYGAKPYLDAMAMLNEVGDRYGCDDGESIVRCFLCNAGTWRGEVAKLVKAELNRRLNEL